MVKHYRYDPKVELLHIHIVEELTTTEYGSLLIEIERLIATMSITTLVVEMSLPSAAPPVSVSKDNWEDFASMLPAQQLIFIIPRPDSTEERLETIKGIALEYGLEFTFVESQDDALRHSREWGLKPIRTYDGLQGD